MSRRQKGSESMKLDKVNLNEKKQSKKGIIIGTSTVAIVTFCGICGWNLLKNTDGDTMKCSKLGFRTCFAKDV